MSAILRSAASSIRRARSARAGSPGVPSPRWPRPVVALLVAHAAAQLVGCDDRRCPAGSRPVGDACLPVAAGDAGPTDDAGSERDGGGCAATPDPIDAQGEDTNCDGADGVAAATVFVAPGGSDDGDGTRDRPVATLARALALASPERPTILLGAGTLEGPLVLRRGLSVHGGYGEGFAGPRARTAIASAGPVVVGRDLGADAGVHVSRVDAIADDGAPASGAPSIAAWFTDATGVLLEAVRLVAGAGADGADGSTPGPAPDGAGGLDGGSGVVLGEAAFCPAGSRPFLFAPVPTPGGEGECCGDGGAGDGSGRGIENGAGRGGEAGMLRGGACTGDRLDNGGRAGEPLAADGGDGAPGSVGQAGAVGRGGAGVGRFLGDGYVPPDGEPGGRGEAGAGGGGGGGGEGCPIDALERCWLAGGAGGGGGAGGCGGLGGGAGGGGGASVALWLWRSEVRLVEVELVAGPGGDGGLGAPGGAGGAGGPGGQGGPRATDYLFSVDCATAGAGGDGGRGGDGGPGGGGGGGAGGSSVALLLGDGSALAAGTRWVEYTTGAPGDGAAGGEGFASARGADGLAFQTLTVSAEGTPD